MAIELITLHDSKKREDVENVKNLWKEITAEVEAGEFKELCGVLYRVKDDSYNIFDTRGLNCHLKAGMFLELAIKSLFPELDDN